MSLKKTCLTDNYWIIKIELLIKKNNINILNVLLWLYVNINMKDLVIYFIYLYDIYVTCNVCFVVKNKLKLFIMI